MHVCILLWAHFSSKYKQRMNLKCPRTSRKWVHTKSWYLIAVIWEYQRLLAHFYTRILLYHCIPANLHTIIHAYLHTWLIEWHTCVLECFEHTFRLTQMHRSTLLQLKYNEKMNKYFKFLTSLCGWKRQTHRAVILYKYCVKTKY